MKHIKAFENSNNKKYWRINIKNYKLSLWKLGMNEIDIEYFLTIIMSEIKKQYPDIQKIYIGYNVSWDTIMMMSILIMLIMNLWEK